MGQDIVIFFSISFIIWRQERIGTHRCKDTRFRHCVCHEDEQQSKEKRCVLPDVFFSEATLSQ